jgi:hypothetical protein
MNGPLSASAMSAVPSRRTFVLSHPAWIRRNFPSFSRETASETFSAMKIGRSGAFGIGGVEALRSLWLSSCAPAVELRAEART